MRTIRTLAALILTLPVYLGAGLNPRSEFAAEWERTLKGLWR